MPELTLTDFLLARIAEDEATARSAVDDEHLLHSLRPIADLLAPPGGEIMHIVRWDPARVLAECETKKRIIERHTRLRDNQQLGLRHLYNTLLDLASVYADHPDFDPSWRVE